MNRPLLLFVVFGVVVLVAVPYSALPGQSSPPAPVRVPAPSPSAPAPRSAAASGPSELDFAKGLMWSGRLDAAIEVFRSLSSGPDAPSAYAGMARVYLRQKKISEAYAAATKAVESAVNSADAHAALGEVLFRQGKILESQKEFRPFIEAGTKEARSYFGMYRVSQAASYYKQAKLMIDQAHALDPSDPEIRHFWARSVSTAERIKELEEFLAANTEDSEEHKAAAARLAILRALVERPDRPCRMVSKVSSTQVSLESLMRDAKVLRSYGLKVKLNGATTRLELDTGASGILVNRKLAEKAGLKRLADTKIGGIGSEGAAAGYVATAETIQIGELEFHDCAVEVVDKTSVVETDGLIGGDVFSHFLVEIDFPDAKFKLSPLPPVPDEPPLPPALESQSPDAAHLHNRYVAPEMRKYTPVFRFGHDLLITTWVNNSPATLFLLDTGAFDNQISPDIASQFTKVRADSDIKVKGLSGKVDKVFTADSVIFRFGNGGYIHLVQHNVVAFDLSHISESTGTEVSGILGFEMLKVLDIKIDYRDGLVDMVFDPSRVH